MTLPLPVYLPEGLHVIADLEGADPALLADAAWLEQAATQAAVHGRAKVLFTHSHPFGEGQGVAGVVLLAESHLTFHTWPEHGFAALDAFMCGDTDPQMAITYLAHALKASGVNLRVLERGQSHSRNHP